MQWNHLFVIIIYGLSSWMMWGMEKDICCTKVSVLQGCPAKDKSVDIFVMLAKGQGEDFKTNKKKNMFLTVNKPLIQWSGKILKNYWYRNGSGVFIEQDAIEEATKDLDIYYQNIFKKGLEISGDKKDKSIALVVVDTPSGFPRDHATRTLGCALVDFIVDNPQAYAHIKLYVKDSEYDWYIQMFEYVTQRQKELGIQ